MASLSMLRLYIFDYGLFQVHENGRIIGIQGYFLDTPTGEKILIDAGFPPWYEEDAEKATQADGLDAFGRLLKLTSENFPKAQLATIGYEPKDVTHLVLTHGDIDHIGRMHEFPDATVVIGKAERAMGRPRYFGGKPRMAWPENASYIEVDADTELWPGVTILLTPGHSPGHLSFLLELDQKGPVVLAGDAINRAEEIEQDRFTGAWDEKLVRSSARRLLDITASKNAWLVYGHDPAQWGTLRKAPEYYD